MNENEICVLRVFRNGGSIIMGIDELPFSNVGQPQDILH